MRNTLFAIPIAGAMAAIVALTLPAPSAAEDATPAWQQAQPSGEPESCVSLNRIRNTEVHDDRTIDFHMSGGQTYRNTLPHDCSGLGFDRAFSYETSLSRLCSTDIITVVRNGGGGISGASCGLGDFQPIEMPPRD